VALQGGSTADLAAWKRVHLVGIGGAGMSGIARLLLARGVAVSGSDLKDSQGLAALRDAGASVFVGHAPAQIGRPDALVVSSAIPPGNTEVDEARRTGVAVLGRAEALAVLMRGRRGVAVAGTHGKTTTTSMISVMLVRLGLDPTYVIGGDLNESGSGAVHGAGEIFVAEADESDESFLLLDPEIAVITNVEEDHLDHYAGRGEIEAAFRAFAARAEKVVACWDDPGVRRSLAGHEGPIVRYGSAEGVDILLRTPELRWNGAEARVEFDGGSIPLSLSVPGRHNLLNAGAALGVASLLALPMGEAAAALRSFSGVRRRFECRGVARAATFIDDYAHHPTEVAATLDAARVDAGSRIVAVFQPHRYTRTQAMWRSLGESLAAADVVVVTDVYGAGERPIPGVTGKLVVNALSEMTGGVRVVYLPRRSDVALFLTREVRPGDLVLTLGAGDIGMVGDETLARIREVGA
jgi:UDP-N-acetylmuramate--alanine ligase